MDKYLVPLNPSPQNPKPIPRRRWKRTAIELNGRFEPKYRHEISGLLMQSYSEGIYLVSVTKSGCLTVHDFEALYCQSNESLPSSKEDEAKHLMHLSLNKQLDVVRWNCANQDEVACTSMKRNEVLIFDIGYVSSEPVEVLRTRQAVTVHGSDSHKGISDIAFTSIDDSRLLASDTSGVISVWDRRMSILPCLELTTNSHSTVNSIELNVENQAQSHIVSKEIHSIDLDPSCPYQLAFHLDDGWSGVLDIYNFKVSHVHCPPPAWLNDSNTSSDLLHLRKPSWLPTYSIYAVGSSSDKGIHLLDFYPDPTSASHVEHRELFWINHQKKQNRFIPLSEGVTACAAHPLNGTIIAGTKLCWTGDMFYILLFNQACKCPRQETTAEAINIGIPKSYRIEDMQNGIES
ncbi:hypothetical protein CFP56_028555 [Quercus suber]|uniref:Uncharacterized protein n=1 Tax=Quercus suber TaxID=58331 RepID=A0AAW0JTS9_QUESU